MPSSEPHSLLDIARAIEASVQDDTAVAGLDREGGAMTLGREGTVRGVRVQRADSGDITVRVDVIGLPGTVLPEAGERLLASLEAELDRREIAGGVSVVFTDIAPVKPQEEGS